MKKLLLTLICMVGALAASAETYTYVMADALGTATNSKLEAWTCGGFTFTPAQSAGGTAPAYNKSGDVRIYANSTLTISASGANITSISFAISSQGMKRLPDITPSVGAIAEQGVNPLVWEGSAPAVTFTVGTNAIYGSEGAGKAGQFDFDSVTITTDGAVTEPNPGEDPNPGEGGDEGDVDGGNGTLESPYTVAQVIAKNPQGGSDSPDESNVWVTGYIVGWADMSTVYYITPETARFSVPATAATNLLLAAAPDVKDCTECIGVQLPSGSVRTALNLVDNPDNLGREVKLKGNIAKYSGVAGLRSVSDYQWVGEVTPPAELPKIETLSALVDFEKGDAFEMDTELTVVYVYGGNVYVYDGINYGMIFKYDLGLKAGDVIAKGWTGKVDLYNGLTELVPDSALTVSGTAELPEPYEVDAEMAGIVLMPYNQNSYLKLLGVTFAEATPSSKDNFTGTMTDGEETYAVNFRNNYGMNSVAAGTYDVLVFVGVYKGDVQVYPVEYLGASEPQDPEIPEIPEIDSLTPIYDMDNGTEFVVGMDLKVLYSNGAYVYVNDGIQNALIYKRDLGLNAGDVIAKGWKASISIYNNLVEIVPAEALTVSGTGAALPSPVDVEADDVPVFVAAYNQSAYLNLKGVTFGEAIPASGSFTGTMGDHTVNFYQRFGLASVEPGTYNVVGFVAVYKTDVQIYPVSFESTTGIEGIEAASASARYYNLQGIEVNHPVEGQLYIRVQGKNATKVIIR